MFEAAVVFEGLRPSLFERLSTFTSNCPTPVFGPTSPCCPSGNCIFVSLLFNDLFGYLDPVSGTMIVQAIVAGIAALSLTIKTNWLKIKTFIYKHIKK